MTLIKSLRIAGAILGILGTAFVVSHNPLAGYWFWCAANWLWMAVMIDAKDWWSTAMFACYQAATIWGLWWLR